MSPTSKMYDQGSLDAQHDELNPFYYQHYFHYRRGYDDTRRQMRAAARGPVSLLALALPLVLALLLGGGWWLLSRADAPATAQTVVTTPLALLSPSSVPTPLALGEQARIVNLNGALMLTRKTPGLGATVAVRLPEGALVTLREGPVAADGYMWWRVEAVEGTGWVPERSPEGLVFLELRP